MLEGQLILHVAPLVKDRGHRHLPGHVLPTHQGDGHGGQGGQHCHPHPHSAPRQVSNIHEVKVGAENESFQDFFLRRAAVAAAGQLSRCRGQTFPQIV